MIDWYLVGYPWDDPQDMNVCSTEETMRKTVESNRRYGDVVVYKVVEMERHSKRVNDLAG